MGDWSLAVDKQDLAERFSKAACDYDSLARVQQLVGAQLLSRLPERRFERGVDLGCGTGFFLPDLAKRCDTLLGLDLAPGMLRVAQQKVEAAQMICGDAEQLPLRDASVDLIFSSLALQWCASLPQALAEIHRVLRPGGIFAFATLGTQSLHELRSAWREVDHLEHVNPFISDHTLQYLCLEHGFSSIDWLNCSHTLHYASLHELLMSLKGVGANQVTGARASGLGGRQRLRALAQAYGKMQGPTGLLPMSYEVCYGVLMR
ncbi:MAG: malonyl-ACP O-methyltransferase BioC [Aeromonadaceae bacterium]